MLVLDPLIAITFTRDPAVQHEVRVVLVAVALMQPLGAMVFVLDGILIGAGDVRYLALAMAAATACYVPFAVLVLLTDAGCSRCGAHCSCSCWPGGTAWAAVSGAMHGWSRACRLHRLAR